MSLLFVKSSSTTCVMSICIISDIFVIDVTIKVNAGAAAGHFLSDLFLIKFDFKFKLVFFQKFYQSI